MRILLTGPTGQIGSELLQALPALGEVIAVDRAQMDLTDPEGIRKIVRSIGPDLVVNAAGYTDVDRAEREEELAHRINATAPGILAQEARRLGAAIIHYSTDYVFNGRATSSYTPKDEPDPINAYGRTKLAGEKAVSASGCASLIIRTSWVYGLRGSNFLSSILEQAPIKRELRVVDDQFGCPTWSRTVARATAQVIARALVRQGQAWSFSNAGGIYHLACQGVTSRFGFAQRIIDLAEISPEPTVVPVPTKAGTAEADRPRFSALCCDSTFRQFEIELPHWEAALEAALCCENRNKPHTACTKREAGS
ncbi:MAG: dTDP-4-dehydrorhamnose reductase [Planctomycetes bacterium]|nr:dTDP-4-dehydrorhamnose reductase [Planctomycetota bacterium]